MSIFRNQNLMVSADAAVVAGGLNVNPTNISSQGTLAIVGDSNVTLTAGNTISDSESLTIYTYITANGSLKRTMRIPGRKVTKYGAVQYLPATRQVTAIGYNRKTAAGSIPVNASTEYQFTVHVKSDKQTYSERNLLITLEFTTSTTATQLTIATQIVNAINGPTGIGASNYLTKLLTAVVVGDGTGAYGLTNATNYGVEVTGNLLTQAVGSYAIETPMFEVDLNDLSGFGQNFRPTTIQTPFQGNGSYQQVYNIENFLLGVEGKINRVIFPIPTDNFTVSSTANLSSSVAGTGNVGITTGSDLVTFATTNASFVPGDLVSIDSVNYEIKYLIGTTQAILTSVGTTTNANSTTKKRIFYDMLEIEFSRPNLFDGAGVIGDSNESVLIAIPGATTATAWNLTSTAAASILAVLNPYFNSLGFASVTL